MTDVATGLVLKSAIFAGKAQNELLLSLATCGHCTYVLRISPTPVSDVITSSIDLTVLEVLSPLLKCSPPPPRHHTSEIT